MDTKKLKSFDQNLIDLLKDAHKWEYTEINDNKEKSLQKKPKLFFTRFQWVLVLLSVVCTILCPNGLSSNFAERGLCFNGPAPWSPCKTSGECR